MTGKGLAFLNKKSWHTSTLANQERVWKAEQVDSAEKKKIEQLKREKLEERKIAELRELNDRAAGIKRQQRVDWLYEQPVSKTTAEDYLLGKKVENWEDVSMASGATAAATAAAGPAAAAAAAAAAATTSNTNAGPAATEEKPGSLWFGDKLDSTVDTANKIRDDPMFLIKQRERDALKQILENPMQMKLLRDDVKHKKDLKKQKKLEKKEKKLQKKLERKQHGNADDSNSSKSDNDDDKDRSRHHHQQQQQQAHHQQHQQQQHHSSQHQSDDRHHHSSSSNDHHHHQRRRDDDDNVDDRRRDDRPSESSHRRRRSRSRSRSRSPNSRRSESSSSATTTIAAPTEKFVNKNYEFYKKLADERASSSWKREPKKSLTEEERNARLNAMAKDAVTHEENRSIRLRRDREIEEKEAAALASRRPDGDTTTFIDQVNKQVYTGGGVASLADRLGREKHFISKNQASS